ncbi:MAG: glutamate-5-semialdehyde dehydrogenase, partial [Bdellovibrionales bacterium]
MKALQEMGRAARESSRFLKTAATEQKNTALRSAAQKLREQAQDILAANTRDLSENSALNAAMLDRLRLAPSRIEAMAHGLETVAALPDPVGETIAAWSVPNGLSFERVRVPLGVIGVIYESRPNVTTDAAALCLKSGNACLLRPGSESFHSAQALASILQEALRHHGLPDGCVQMVPSPDRALVGEMLRMNEAIDVIIPRGGKSLIARVQEESRVPVLAHLDGNNHVYVDRDADVEMAVRVTLNA